MSTLGRVVHDSIAFVVIVLAMIVGFFIGRSENDGFHPLELLGILGWKTQDIFDQMRGLIRPDHVTRTLIDDPEEIDE